MALANLFKQCLVLVFVAFWLTGCQPAAKPALPEALVASANPLEKEGQITFVIALSATQPELQALPRHSDGTVNASGLPFRLLAAKQELAGGTVKDNRILLAPDVVGSSQPPYALQLELPKGQIFEAQINELLKPGAQVRVTAGKIIAQTCTGQGCVNAGDVNVDVNNTRVEGPLCAGICIDQSEKKKDAE